MGGSMTAPLAHAAWSAPAPVIALLVLGAVLYAAGLARRRRRAGDRLRAAAYAAALIVLAAALVSPLHALARELLIAHMVQHLLLLLAVAPLLVAAAPLAVLLAALPRPLGRALARVRRAAVRASRRLGPAWLALVALTLHLGTLWLWHAPGPYAAALRSDALHALEHVTLLAGAVALAAVVGATRAPRRGGHGSALLALLGATAGATALGALMTFAGRPWYALHGGGHGLTALEDQQLAGLAMWVPGGVIYVIGAVLLVGWWLRAAEHRVAAGSSLTVALCVSVLLGGCGGDEPAAPPPAVRDGDPRRGLQAIVEHGCGACHAIPGVEGADATVGPPLSRWSERAYIAGALPNNADNLVRWISDPQSVEPGTAMPDVGVDEALARDIAAYLFTLR